MGVGFEIGTVVGDRRIDAVVGEGGMGVVYRAWNLRLKRIEAVKVITETLVNDQGFRERFERETEIAASIEHPHVITLYASGEGPGGQLFIAMRYVEGTNLGDLIARRGRLEPRLAADLISQVASALDAAHSQGLVHRDVKPANILISGRDGDYQAFLTDFGIAKRVASRTMFTGTGMMLGSVDYMAPEQARGEPVDALADVYALGATLFKALTGTIPYPGEHDLARIVAKLEGPPPPVTQVVAGIPSAFDAVIARAMAIPRQDRYPSAGELGRAARAAAGQPSKSHSVMPDLGVGSVVGECLLEEIAAEGGMAVVYRATQLKLDRTVAVKVMSRDLVDDPAFRARFEREWKIAAAIDHPSVIPIYAAGDAQGVLYIVMRYVGGGSVKEALLARGRLDPEQAVEVIEQVASALDAAHARGLVHRDVKPGNVLIDDVSGRVFLTDFGLAKGLEDDDLTDRGQILGTARYMPPERNRGGGDDVRGDVYSLGCLLWDLLGGTERRNLTRVDGVPPALAGVVERATALEPAARHRSAGELGRAARAALTAVAGEDRPVGAAAADAPGVSSAAGRRRRAPFEPPALSSGLSERVLRLCRTVAELTPDPTRRAALEEVRAELVAPLRVVVCGPDGAGRAALVNALVGRRILGPQPRPGTVSFAYGAPERVETGFGGGGGEADRALAPDGSLPVDLGVASAVELRVWLPVEALRTLSLVCPPTGAPGASGDAYVVVVEETPAAAALDALLPGVRISAVNTAVALSRVDRLEAEGRAAADRAKQALGAKVAGVAAFIGPLAEAANAGLIDDEHVDALRRLAGADGAVRAAALASASAFAAADVPVAAEERARLLARIGLLGVRAAMELADAGPLSVIALTRWLRELSGIEAIDGEIDGFHRRADALKAGRALARLEALSFRWPELAFLRDQVEAARLEPEMHLLDLTRAFERCVADELDVPAELLDTLERLICARTAAGRVGLEDGADRGEQRRSALDAFQAWKMFENGSQSSPAARRVARAASRSFELLARQTEPAEDGRAPR